MRSIADTAKQLFVGGIFLSMCVPQLLSAAEWGKPDFTVPPGFAIVWDVGPKGSTVSQQFAVTEHRFYHFELAFTRPISLEGLKELFKFTGDGSTIWVTKETANDKDPVSVQANTPEDEQRLQHGILAGDYVARMERSGVMIPVHLRVAVENPDFSLTIVYEETIDTWNIRGDSPAGIVRTITNVPLRPGKYILTATTTRETHLPPNIKTALSVAYDPRTQVFRDR